VHLVGIIREVCDNKRMHGMEYFRKTDAEQARLINNYMSVKRKLLKTNTVISFNKICKRNTVNICNE
jgi:hypothetical protein